MRRRHLHQVHAIEQQTSHRPWSLDLFSGEIKQRDSWCCVALAGDGSVTGFGCLMTTGFETHITNVAVDPKLQRQGIGRQLVAALLDQTVRLGLDDATLEVRMTNHAAQRLYQSFGFAPAGVRPNYYADVGEDALIMWVHELSQRSST